MKSINILWEPETPHPVRSAIESLINAFEDFAYGYDVYEEALEAIIQVLDDHDINWEYIEIEETEQCKYKNGHICDCTDETCYLDTLSEQKQCIGFCTNLEEDHDEGIRR